MAHVFDPEGNFSGPDDGGLPGLAIVMNPSDFSAGMAHDDALKYNLGAGVEKDQDAFPNDEAYQKFTSTYNGLKYRPDWDGVVGVMEAIKWYNTGHGNLFISILANLIFNPVY